MEINKKVSVIVPMYNSEDYIHDSLSSLLNQTYKNIEILVVDDGSDDESYSLVEKLVTQNKTLKIIRNPDKGANAARKFGVEQATGEYIIFMDADDRWCHHAIDKMISTIVYFESDIVCCNMELLEGSVVSKEKIFNYDRERCNKLIELSKGISALYDVPPSACAKIFKKKLLDKISFIDVPFSQDWNITYKYLKFCKNIVFIDDALYSYCVKNESTSSYQNKTCTDVVKACDSIVDICKSLRGGAGEFEWKAFSTILEARYYLAIYSRASFFGSDDKDFIYREVKNKINLRVDLFFMALKGAGVTKDSVKLLYFYFITIMYGVFSFKVK